MVENKQKFYQQGWLKFPIDPRLVWWLDKAIPPALAAINDPKHANWLRCGGTWFAGVNALPNDTKGAINGSGPLSGEATDFLASLDLPARHWDAAQVSVIYPGYPKPMQGESDAAFRFRRDRNAAHVDGLLPVGAQKRRHLQEPHAFVLGLPMTQTSVDASPLVVWEGSHDIMRNALGDILTQHDPKDWPNVDLTDAYQAARRTVFDNCKRVLVHAKPGEAYIIHRLALHGVAPWAQGAMAPKEGRVIAYFRPELTGELADWINAP